MNAHQHLHRSTPARSFTITELLVVIGIIVLLAGLLLVALGRVRTSSLKTATVSTMQSFGRACDAFQAEHGQYPGVIPEAVLARAIVANQINLNTATDGTSTGLTTISSTENALLHLMGGYRLCPPGVSGCPQVGGSPTANPIAADYDNFDFTYELTIGPSGPDTEWRLRININRIGEGPVINGKPFAPYFTPGPREVAVTPGQVRPDGTDDPPEIAMRLPDLLDAWGMPILYTRRVRSVGPLVGDVGASPQPQFYIDGMRPYFEATQLGERGINQQSQSILALNTSNTNYTMVSRQAVFAQLIRHPSFGKWDGDAASHPMSPENRGRVAPRGEYVLISAGPDSVYFAQFDGPGTPANWVKDIVADEEHATPQAVASYDDILVFGGG